jgi:hypothetical protein
VQHCRQCTKGYLSPITRRDMVNTRRSAPLPPLLLLLLLPCVALRALAEDAAPSYWEPMGDGSAGGGGAFGDSCHIDVVDQLCSTDAAKSPVKCELCVGKHASKFHGPTWHCNATELAHYCKDPDRPTPSCTNQLNKNCSGSTKNMAQCCVCVGGCEAVPAGYEESAFPDCNHADVQIYCGAPRTSPLLPPSPPGPPSPHDYNHDCWALFGSCKNLAIVLLAALGIHCILGVAAARTKRGRCVWNCVLSKCCCGLCHCGEKDTGWATGRHEHLIGSDNLQSW